LRLFRRFDLKNFITKRDYGGLTLTSAIIDLGSNTIKMSILDYQNEEILSLLRESENVGLVSYVMGRKLSAEGIIKVCETLDSYRTLAKRFVSEDEIFVFSTASLRNIDNREKVLEVIKAETGIVPIHLSGEEEARLDFIGVKHATKAQNGFLIDVGGASTELVSFLDDKIQNSISVPVGALKLYIKHAKLLTVTKPEAKAIKKDIDKAFDKFDWKGIKSQTLTCVGGTARTALGISKTLFNTEKDSLGFPASHIENIIKMLQKGKIKVYKCLYQVAPDRVLILYPGLLIINEAIKRLKSKEILISKYGIREGFYLDHVLKLDQKHDNTKDA
jgi:exopolyphosphatase/guanosine-5'-triphosphate,3'-diphosphate pyrophosphatase